MRGWVWSWLVVLASCGRLGFDPTGGDGGAATDDGIQSDAPCTFTPWVAVPQTGLNGPNADWSPAFAGDALHMVFESDRPGTGSADLYEAMRATDADLFANPTQMPFNTVGLEQSPTMSSDGLQIVFSGAGNRTATRASLADPWSAVTAFNLNGFAFEFGGHDLDIVYTRTNAGVNHIVLATRPTTQDAFVEVRELTELVFNATGGYASLSNDGLEIYYELGGGGGPIQLARRPDRTPSTPFVFERALTELVNADDPDISTDGHSLLFAPSQDISLAHRDCQ